MQVLGYEKALCFSTFDDTFPCSLNRGLCSFILPRPHALHSWPYSAVGGGLGFLGRWNPWPASHPLGSCDWSKGESLSPTGQLFPIGRGYSIQGTPPQAVPRSGCGFSHFRVKPSPRRPTGRAAEKESPAHPPSSPLIKQISVL